MISNITFCYLKRFKEHLHSTFFSLPIECSILRLLLCGKSDGEVDNLIIELYRSWLNVCIGHVCLVKHKNLVDKVSSSESPRRTWKSNILSYSRVLTVDLMASNQLWWFTTLYVTYGWTKIYSLRLHHLLYFFSCDTQFTFTIWNKILRTCKEKFKSI